MRKHILTIVITILAVVIAVGGVAYLRSSQEATRQNEQAAGMKRSSPDTDEVTKTKEEGAYVAYSQSALDSTSGRRVLFFHASWCPQCRMIDADIKSSNIPSGVTIFKVDYDTNQELRAKYGVTLQTTFVEIDASDELVNKYVAYNEPTFDSLNENLLSK